MVLLLGVLAALVGSSSSQASSKASQAKFKAALVSDIGKFTDRSFNQSQLEGLKRAQKQLHINILPLQSNSSSDYIPNLNQAVRAHANVTIAAGFLLADSLETIADKFPKSKFAITDYCAKGAAKCITGSVLARNHKNIMGLDFAANQSGCLVGYLAAEMTKKQGGKQVIGVVGGLHIPPVDIWIAGYQFCAKLYNKNIQVLIGYSGDFVAADKCKTVAENQIAQGAQVLFQVAGGCGLGTLTAAAQAGIWGIGVDKDQYKDAKRVLTSGVKRVDLGVFNLIKATMAGKYKGNKDLQFTLANGGMSVGKINPAVPKRFITAMNKIKARIIKGTLKVPTKL
ncbi:MAG: BMP family ABC transporter substrate-binding protein [Actinomycetota bacterium]|nr:BMP family ABC transporter substrate-binding protein [Actinomycetota bacterium]